MLRRFLELLVDKKGDPITDEQRKQHLNYKIFNGGLHYDKQFGRIQLEKTKISSAQLKCKYGDIMSRQGQYPVIYLDLKDCTLINYKQFEIDFRNKILQLFKYHGRSLLNSNKIIGQGIKIKEQYLQYFNLIKSGDMSTLKFSLKYLCNLLFEHFDQKVWVLIDQYDTPINSSFLKYGKNDFQRNKRTNKFQFKENGTFKKSILFMKGIISSVGKGNQFVQKVIFTGILPFTKSSMTSGLNNIKIFNLMSEEFSDHYGFSNQQMHELMNHFYPNKQVNNQSLVFKDIKQICNGYRVGNSKQKFNAWSVINYLNSKNPETINQAWTSSGSFDLVDQILMSNKGKSQQLLIELIHGKSLQIDIKSNIEYQDLMLGNSNTFLTVLLFTGYLTLDNKKNYVKIPNQSIKICLKEQIAKWITQFIPKPRISEVFQLLQNNQINEFQKKLQKLLDKTSFMDISCEKDVHNLMTGLFLAQPQQYFLVLSNRESGKGRFDNLIMNKQSNTAYIIEYKFIKQKKCKQSQIEELAKKGLQQIQENQYSKYLKIHYQIQEKDIKNIVIVFVRRKPHVFKYETVGKKQNYQQR